MKMAGSAGGLMRFAQEDTGAVTIDWVALTAGILLLGIVVVFSVFNVGVSPVVAAITSQIGAAKVISDVGIAPSF
jgi:uncharacterized integral membrane protein